MTIVILISQMQLKLKSIIGLDYFYFILFRFYITHESTIAGTYQIHYISTEIKFFSVNYANVDDYGKTLFSTIGIDWEKLEKDHSYNSNDSKYLYNHYSEVYDNKYVKCNEQLSCCITANKEATTCDYRQFTKIPKVDSSNSAFVNIIVVVFILVFFI